MTDPAPALDPHAILGVDLGADDAAIRAAYRAAVQAHPPERDPDGFRRVRAAFEALKDPVARVEGLLAEPLLPAWEGDDLGVPPPPVPALADLLRDLREALLFDTDLLRREFPEDLRRPGGDAPGVQGDGGKRS
jgi:curved DNA-binding protein CbpA